MNQFSSAQKAGLWIVAFLTFACGATYTYHDRVKAASPQAVRPQDFCGGTCLWKVVQQPGRAKSWLFIDGQCANGAPQACQCRVPNVILDNQFHVGDIYVTKCTPANDLTEFCENSLCQWSWSTLDGWIPLRLDCVNGCTCEEPNLFGAYQPYNGEPGTFIDIGFIIVNGATKLRPEGFNPFIRCRAVPSTYIN